MKKVFTGLKLHSWRHSFPLSDYESNKILFIARIIKYEKFIKNLVVKFCVKNSPFFGNVSGSVHLTGVKLAVRFDFARKEFHNKEENKPIKRSNISQTTE